MTETKVTYVRPNRTDAGAVPVNTQVATHPRASDGANVQDVFIDPVNTVTVTREDNLYNDAFQRLRTSDTDQRFDGDFSYDLSPLLFDNISATGTLTFNANTRDVTLATASTSTAVTAGLRQHYANPYTKGNSQFIAMTGTLNGANIAGGRVVFADYAAPAAAGVKSSGKTGILDKIPLAVSALGVGDILSICCIRNGTTNSLTQAALNWTEVR